METAVALEPIARLRRDIKQAGKLLSDRRARHMTDLYYALQEKRLQTEGQLRAIHQGADDVEGSDLTFEYFHEQFERLEDQMKSVLGEYARTKPAGVWAQGVCGIGNVLSAGLLANIDIHRAPHVGHVWAFAGLAGKPKKPVKGEKRTYSTGFKSLCAFKIGESFVKVQANDKDVYGKMYSAKKQQYIAINEAGGFADAARQALEEKNYGKDTDAYKAYIEGKLPKAHVHARARRWAVKMFLSHFHQVLFESTFRRPAPRPWIIDVGGHADYVPAPGWSLEDFLSQS